jgi:hypothetical protein
MLDTFIRWMAALPAQLDAFLAQLSTLAAGGANTFSYKFDIATADADPGAGKLRLGSAVQNTATVLRLDPITGSGVDISAVLASLLTGTSNVKASLRIQKRNDPSKWLIFDVLSGSGTGYLNLVVAPRAGSVASPFVADDDLMIYLDKAGDKGDTGNADKKVQTAPSPSGGVVSVDYKAGNCLVWNLAPYAGQSLSLQIANWPAAGTLGEFWIIGTNMGAATVSMFAAVSWLKADGTYTSTVSINTNQGATLRTSGEDNVLLWGRSGVPDHGKVAR